MIDIVERYRQNYIKEIRKDVGHAPLMTTACGVIIENEKGELLLQKRRDNGCWGLLGGAMEIGEKFLEVAKREVYEEALEHRFFGKDCIPDNINSFDRKYVADWVKGSKGVIVD